MFHTKFVVSLYLFAVSIAWAAPYNNEDAAVAASGQTPDAFGVPPGYKVVNTEKVEQKRYSLLTAVLCLVVVLALLISVVFGYVCVYYRPEEDYRKMMQQENAAPSLISIQENTDEGSQSQSK